MLGRAQYKVQVLILVRDCMCLVSELAPFGYGCVQSKSQCFLGFLLERSFDVAAPSLPDGTLLILLLMWYYRDFLGVLWDSTNVEALSVLPKIRCQILRQKVHGVLS